MYTRSVRSGESVKILHNSDILLANRFAIVTRNNILVIIKNDIMSLDKNRQIETRNLGAVSVIEFAPKSRRVTARTFPVLYKCDLLYR